MSIQEQMNRFAAAPMDVGVSRSLFNRNHSVKFSFNVGQLIPFYIDDVMPGDTFTVNTSKVVRVQPLVTPVMDNLFLDTYYFFVPYRLVWSHWKNFMGESAKAWIPQVTYTTPKIVIPTGGFPCGSIADYLGVPIGVGDGVKINALPFRSYALIASEWFRDTSTQDAINVPVTDSDVIGENDLTLALSQEINYVAKGGKPYQVTKYPDYFTSCLPSPQRRSTPIGISLGDNKAPVISLSSTIDDISKYNYAPVTFGYPDSDDNLNAYENEGQHQLFTGSNGQFKMGSGTVSTAVKSDSLMFNNLFVDASDFDAIPINEFRFAFALQRYYEKLARGGDRYVSIIKSFYGVDSPDARMQRPEYLGGNRLPLNVSQVENVTNQSTNIDPIGSVAGLSVTGDVNSDFTKSFTEHGIVMGVCCVRYNHTYQQGIDPIFQRSTVFDYYNPTFANIGEQPVKKQTIYLSAANAANDPNNSTFGYQEYAADYRYKPNRVAGELRSAYTTPLDMWHFADEYASLPYFNLGWMKEDLSPVDRCLAVTSSVSNQLIADFYIECHASRPMPLYSIPGLIDHH